MELYLDAKETELLQGFLEHRLEDLRREIHHTDLARFKAGLKADQEVLERILVKLKMPAAMGI